MAGLLHVRAWSPRERALLACIVLLVGVLGAMGAARTANSRPAREPLPAPVAASAGQRGAVVLVDVAGAVRRPGVYEVQEGARVLDAIRAAGGTTARADPGAVNRAAPVVDGQQVLVPERVEPGAVSGAVGSARAAPGGRVSLNAADVQALDALPGIGPVTAQKIVDDRTANGPFRAVEDLDRVPGIGEATVERLRDSVGP